MGLIEETIKMRRNQEELLENQKQASKLIKQKQTEQEEKLYNKDVSKTYEKRLQMIFNEYFENERIAKSIYYFALKRNT